MGRYRVFFAAAIFSCFSLQAQAQTKYEYDALGRLVEVERVDANKTVTYTYDAAGNRTSVVQAAIPPAEFSINDVSVSEGGLLSFSVTKTGGASQSYSVDYATANGTASSNDYQTASGTLSFASSETSKTVTVQTTHNIAYENDETVLLNLSNATNGALLADGQGVGTIINDDPAPTFAVNDVAIEEGLGLTFTLTKSGSTTFTHDVNYGTSNGSAVAPADYVMASGTVSFAWSETSKTVTINSVEDSVLEAAETFYLNLSNATNGATIADSQGVGTINNDDGAPSFAINDVTVTEGSTATFTVTKSGSTALSHNVNYATAHSSANGSDYTAKSGTLTFGAGETSKTVSVSTANDSTYEQNEAFLINLSGATNGATISDSQGVGTINNNDAGPSFTINNVSAEEGLGLTFTITKSGPTSLTHNVNYATANGTATAPADYTATSGTLSFTSGQTSKTVTVNSVEESVIEANETFYVNLSSATNGATISDSQGVGTINNDDSNSPPVAVDDSVSGTSPGSVDVYPLANDSDPNGDTITLTSHTTSSGTITATWDSVAKKMTISALIAGTYWVDYTISDGNGGTDTGRINVTFQGGGGCSNPFDCPT